RVPSTTEVATGLSATNFTGPKLEAASRNSPTGIGTFAAAALASAFICSTSEVPAGGKTPLAVDGERPLSTVNASAFWLLPGVASATAVTGVTGCTARGTGVEMPLAATCRAKPPRKKADPAALTAPAVAVVTDPDASWAATGGDPIEKQTHRVTTRFKRVLR